MNEFMQKWGAMPKSQRRKVKREMQSQIKKRVGKAGAKKMVDMAVAKARKEPMRGEMHEYDQARPSRPVVSRYAT